MDNYKIAWIKGNGYERFASVISQNTQNQICVHFIEYDEYLENGEKVKKRNEGDYIKGNLKIDLVDKVEVSKKKN